MFWMGCDVTLGTVESNDVYDVSNLVPKGPHNAIKSPQMMCWKHLVSRVAPKWPFNQDLLPLSQMSKSYRPHGILTSPDRVQHDLSDFNM